MTLIGALKQYTIIFINDLYTKIRTAARNLFLMTKLDFPLQKTYNLTYIINFWVRGLHTWIRTAASRIQQLPADKKIILMPNLEFPLKNIKFDICDQFLGKWPLYLDKDGCQQDPAAARCTEIYFWWQNCNSHPKKHIIWHTWSLFG